MSLQTIVRSDQLIRLEPAPLNQVRVDVPDDDGWHYVKGQLYNTSHERLVVRLRPVWAEGKAAWSVVEVELAVGRLEVYLPLGDVRPVRFEGRERIPVAMRFRGTMPGATLTPGLLAWPVGRWS